MIPKTLSAVLAAVACSASLTQAQLLLHDNFTGETALPEQEWTIQSSLLNSLAAAISDPPLTNVRPMLNFGYYGMQMTGVTNIYEFTGIQSVANFTPPFTLITKVNGLVASGCPFAIFLVNSNLTQWLNLQGNVSSINSGYYGVWLNYTGLGKTVGSRGVSLFASPSTNVLYTVQFSIASDGTASASCTDAYGVGGALSGFMAGRGPFYVILAQKEGYPSVPGPNAAVWESDALGYGTSPPPLPPVLSLNLGPAPIWSTNGMSLELTGPYGSYVVEAVSNLSAPLRWQTVQYYSSSNWSFRFDFTDSLATNYGGRFYRARSQ